MQVHKDPESRVFRSDERAERISKPQPRNVPMNGLATRHRVVRKTMDLIDREDARVQVREYRTTALGAKIEGQISIRGFA
jgi:hypothetical protein